MGDIVDGIQSKVLRENLKQEQHLVEEAMNAMRQIAPTPSSPPV